MNHLNSILSDIIQKLNTIRDYDCDILTVDERQTIDDIVLLVNNKITKENHVK